MQGSYKPRATCKRPGCREPVYPHPVAEKDYLCEMHFYKRSENTARRIARKNKVCQRAGCKQSLGDSRNRKYCSDRCRFQGRRLRNDDHTLRTTQHSYWKNAERLIKENPHGTGSLRAQEDIAGVINLYQHKARHQRSYSDCQPSPLSGRARPKLVPLLKLDLCHLYPNSLGGENSARNIIIAPSFINKLVGNKVPVSERYPVLNGFRTYKKQPLTQSLYRYVVENSNENNIQAFFRSLGKLKTFTFNQVRDPDISNIPACLPFFTLLQEELLRLGMSNIVNRLKKMNEVFALEALDLEIIALCLFYCLLTGDKPGLIREVELFSLIKDYTIGKKILRSEKHPDLIRKRWEKKIIRFVSRYFHCDITTKTKMTAFYNSFFTLPPLT